MAMSSSGREEAKSLETKNDSLPLLSFPAEIDFKIANQSPLNQSTKTMAALSQTCHQMHQFFKLELQKRAPIQLAQYIITSNPAKAEAMVKINPKLLLLSVVRVVNENTKQIFKNVMPLQLAFGERNEIICLMLEPYFKFACGDEKAGREEIYEQLVEKFSVANNETAETEKSLTDNLEYMLADIIAAITDEEFNLNLAGDKKIILSETILAAIAAFTVAFDASQPKIVTTGVRFRHKILQQALDTYSQAARQWDYKYNHCALFEDAVLARILKYVPVSDAMNFCKGLSLEHNLLFKPSLMTQDGYDFYATLSSVSKDFRLSSCCIDIFSGRVPFHARGLAFPMAMRANDLKVYYEAKNSILNDFMQRAISLKQAYAEVFRP